MALRSLRALELILMPEGRATLDDVLAACDHAKHEPGILLLQADAETLINAAKLGRDYARDESARCWGQFQ